MSRASASCLVCLREGCGKDATVTVGADVPARGYKAVYPNVISLRSGLSLCDVHRAEAEREGLLHTLGPELESVTNENLRTMGLKEADFSRAVLRFDKIERQTEGDH